MPQGAKPNNHFQTYCNDSEVSQTVTGAIPQGINEMRVTWFLIGQNKSGNYGVKSPAQRTNHRYKAGKMRGKPIPHSEK